MRFEGLPLYDARGVRGMFHIRCIAETIDDYNLLYALTDHMATRHPQTRPKLRQKIEEEILERVELSSQLASDRSRVESPESTAEPAEELVLRENQTKFFIKNLGAFISDQVSNLGNIPDESGSLPLIARAMDVRDQFDTYKTSRGPDINT